MKSVSKQLLKDVHKQVNGKRKWGVFTQYFYVATKNETILFIRKRMKLDIIILRYDRVRKTSLAMLSLLGKVQILRN